MATAPDVRLSFTFMAVPERAAHVDKMSARLEYQSEVFRFTHVVAPDPPRVSVVWDGGPKASRRGPWETWRAAWEDRDPGATHHVVLQDDVIFCADLPHTLAQMAKARPRDVVSCFLPRKSVERAVAAGVSWVSCRRFLWAQCVMMPVDVGDDLVAWVRAAEAEGGERVRAWRAHDDVRIAEYLAAKRMPVYVPVPHPVEHIGHELGGSTLGHNGPAAKRVARAWIGPEARGAGLPWEDLRCVRE